VGVAFIVQAGEAGARQGKLLITKGWLLQPPRPLLAFSGKGILY